MTKAEKKARRAARKSRPSSSENKALGVPENKGIQKIWSDGEVAYDRGLVSHELMRRTWLDRVKACLGIR